MLTDTHAQVHTRPSHIHPLTQMHTHRHAHNLHTYICSRSLTDSQPSLIPLLTFTNTHRHTFTDSHSTLTHTSSHTDTDSQAHTLTDLHINTHTYIPSHSQTHTQHPHIHLFTLKTLTTHTQHSHTSSHTDAHRYTQTGRHRLLLPLISSCLKYNTGRRFIVSVVG